LGRQALQASHRLNILAALFFPLTAIASLFGMNLAHGMNERRPEIFWLICVSSVSLGFVMKGWVLGKTKSQETNRKR
jgi:Mg2+ and Co2+ transporter CorA